VAAKIVVQIRKDLTPPEEFTNGKLATCDKTYYREKGTGRTTKKDRRELDDYMKPDEPDSAAQ
jgi:ribosome-associated heat shock protein Hsp15